MKRSILIAISCLLGAALAQETPAPESGETAGPGAFAETMAALDAFLETHEVEPEAPTGETVVLSARECVDRALTHNAKAAVAAADREAAEARIGQAKSQWKPQISGSISFTHTEFNQNGLDEIVSGGGLGGGLGGIGGMGGGALQGGPLPGGGLAPWNQAIQLKQQLLTRVIGGGFDFGPEDDFRTDKISLTQVFYAGGRISAAVKASEFLAESEAWREEAALSQLEFDAKQAFFDLAAAASLVRVAENSVETYERNARDTTLQLEEGAISPFEDMRSRTELGIRRVNLVEAQNARRLAQANLCRIVGLPQNTAVALDIALEWEPALPTASDLEHETLQNLPEINALENAIEAAGQDIRRAKGQYKPQVAGKVEYQNVDGGGLAQPDGLTFSIGAELDIYTGGRRKHEVQEKQAQLRGLEAQLQEVEDGALLQLKRAVIQLEDAMATYRADKSNVDLAREGLRLAELRYREGVGTQAETLDAELALTSAENALVMSLRDFAMANAAIERATGRRWGDPVAVDPEGAAEPARASGE